MEDVDVGEVTGDEPARLEHGAGRAHSTTSLPRYASTTVSFLRTSCAGPFRDHASLCHHDHPVGVVHHDLHVVLDEEDGRPVARPHLLDALEQATRERRIHAGERFVQEHEARREHERARKLEELALAARERSGVLAGVTAQLERLEQLVRARPHFTFSASRCEGSGEQACKPLAGVVRRGKEHVVEHAHHVQRLRQLERPHEPAAGDRVGRQVVDRPAVEPDGAAACALEAGDDVEERRLARAVRADQRRDRAALDAEARAVHGADAAEALLDALDLEDGVTHRAASPASCRRSPAAGTPSAG